jgi:hypothetical protein
MTSPMLGVKVVAFGALVLFVVLIAALQGDAATSLVVGVLAAVALVGWWRRSPAAAGSALSLAVTLLGTSMTTAWAGDQTPLVSPLQAGLVFWLFASVVAVVVWLMPHAEGRNRALTTALAHAVLLAASPFVVLAPAVVPIAGFGAAMGVVAWRGRRSMRTRLTVDHVEPVNRAAEARGVGRTAEALAAACSSDWHLLGPRMLPAEDSGPRPLEQVLVGPPGVCVVETRSWQGNVELVDLPDNRSGASGVSGAHRAYALDGDTSELAARLAPIARNVGRVADVLGVDAAHAYGLVVFWDGTSLPDDAVELTVLTGDAHVVLVLLRGDHLATWLEATPFRLSRSQVQSLADRVDATFQMPT